MPRFIDLNADLGEGFGPWKMGDDEGLIDRVTSANIACGGHASDPETMYATLRLAAERGVSIGAHPGYPDLLGFGRRVLPMSPGEIERLIAAQVGALMGLAALAGAVVRYVKPHGALANLAAADEDVAAAVAGAVWSVSSDLALLAISGTALERAGETAGLAVFSEVFADRAYLPSGQLMPRDRPGAVLTDADAAADRLVEFLETGRMPTASGGSVALAADSVCVHGDNREAVDMIDSLGLRLAAAGWTFAPFVGD